MDHNDQLWKQLWSIRLRYLCKFASWTQRKSLTWNNHCLIGTTSLKKHHFKSGNNEENRRWQENSTLVVFTNMATQKVTWLTPHPLEHGYDRYVFGSTLDFRLYSRPPRLRNPRAEPRSFSYTLLLKVRWRRQWRQISYAK